MDPAVLEEMEKLARAKAIIRKLESSNGQNMDHALLTAGPNKGQRAGGAYGIVPNSLIDFVKQSKNRAIEVDPELVEAMSQDHDLVTKRLNEDRGFDEKAAEMALRLVLKKAGGDEEKAAYGWRTGHNKSMDALAKGAAEHPYVDAYRKERENYDANNQNMRMPASESSGEESEPPVTDRIKKFLGI